MISIRLLTNKRWKWEICANFEQPPLAVGESSNIEQAIVDADKALKRQKAAQICADRENISCPK